MSGAGGETTAAGAANGAGQLGPLTAVAGPSVFKPLFYGLVHLLYAAMFGAPGVILVFISLSEKKGSDDFWPLLGIGAVMSLVGVLILLAAIRRLAIAGNSRVRILAGPGGISLTVPKSPGLAGFFRLGFEIQTVDLAWRDIAKWYPYLRTVNGIPTESALIFELNDGRRIDANTMFYGASRGRLVQKIDAAMQATA